MATTSASTPGNLTLEAYQGDAFTRHITVTAGGVAFDFTGYTAKFTVRRYRGAATADVSLTDGAGITFGSGTIDIAIAAATMAGLKGNYVYDLEVTPAGGAVLSLLSGKFIVPQDVSE